MNRHAVRVALGGAVAAVVVGTLSACGSSGGGAQSPSNGSSAQQHNGMSVKVSLTDFKIGLSTESFMPGDYAFEISNDGKATHEVSIKGPGIADESSTKLGPGEKTTLNVTLQEGKYEIWCPIANHKQMGMDTTITVGSGGGGSSAPSSSGGAYGGGTY